MLLKSKLKIPEFNLMLTQPLVYLRGPPIIPLFIVSQNPLSMQQGFCTNWQDHLE